MLCAVRGCGEEAATIYRGYSLCERCDTLCDEIPVYVPASLLERIIADALSDEFTLEEALAKQGFAEAEKLEPLQAEIERLLLDNAELSAECDQWQKKVADCWREIERLRAQLT